ncbi:MAG: alpha/beta fold hydrolase [Betaproteobacteria bacterium]
MWTALFLAAAVAGGAVAYGMGVAQAVADGAPVWLFIAGIPLAFLALPLFFTILWFLLAWWFGAERPPKVRLTLTSWSAMFLRECWALARSVPRMIFYRQLMPIPAPAKAMLPVVLLHGVGCNAGVWTGFKRHLDSGGFGPVYALSYGPPLYSMELFADQLAIFIAEIRMATGASEVVLVAHSMGGLVARAYMRRYGAGHVRRLVTIGTPHHGSMLAWIMAGTSLAQLRPGNAWLAELNADASPAMVPAVSIWSWHDSMVAPQTSSRIDWGENIELSGVAHNALLDHPCVWAEVAAQIERAATSGSPV